MLRGSRDSGNMLTVEEVRNDKEQNPPRMFVEDCVDGIILYGFMDPWYRQKALELDIPIVDVNSNIRNGPHSITFGEEEGAALAAEHFAADGRHRPAIVLPEDESHFSVQARYEGFRQEALAHGLPEPVVCRVGPGRYWYGEAREFLKANNEIDCVLLYNTILATVLYDELREADLSVPDEVAIIGTGSHTVAYTVRPSLTHLYLDHAALGRGAVRALLERIDGNPIPEDLRRFSYGLSERYST
jgi:DNA-binding LacI/PurR family transcriptional regulator